MQCIPLWKVMRSAFLSFLPSSFSAHYREVMPHDLDATAAATFIEGVVRNAHDMDTTAVAFHRWGCLHTPPTGACEVAYVVMGVGLLDK